MKGSPKREVNDTSFPFVQSCVKVQKEVSASPDPEVKNYVHLEYFYTNFKFYLKVLRTLNRQKSLKQGKYLHSVRSYLTTQYLFNSKHLCVEVILYSEGGK